MSLAHELRPTTSRVGRSDALRRRARIVRAGDHLRIDIGLPRRGVLVLVVLMLSAWIGIGSRALVQLLAPNTPDVGRAFMSMWLAEWTFGGGAVLGAIAWKVLRREVLFVEAGTVHVRCGVGPVGVRRRYDRARIVNLRAEEPPPGRRAAGFLWPPAAETIAFDHGAETVCLGRGLGGDDVGLVLDALRARPPGAR